MSIEREHKPRAQHHEDKKNQSQKKKSEDVYYDETLSFVCDVISCYAPASREPPNPEEPQQEPDPDETTEFWTAALQLPDDFKTDLSSKEKNDIVKNYGYTLSDTYLGKVHKYIDARNVVIFWAKRQLRKEDKVVIKYLHRQNAKKE